MRGCHDHCTAGRKIAQESVVARPAHDNENGQGNCDSGRRPMVKCAGSARGIQADGRENIVSPTLDIAEIICLWIDLSSSLQGLVHCAKSMTFRPRLQSS